MCLAIPAALAQTTMKVSGDGGPPERDFFFPCAAPEQPRSSGTGTPATPGSISIEPVALPPGTPQHRYDWKFAPAAIGEWQVVSQGVVNYCVRAGVVNGGNFASSAPLKLELFDQRGIDVQYQFDYAEANLTIPTSHIAATTCAATISQPVPANSQTLLPVSWCLTNVDWKRRPKLILKLSNLAQGLPDPACRPKFYQVNFPDLARLSTTNLAQSLGAPVAQCGTATLPVQSLSTN
jgi:hypothetical protein